MVAHTPEFAAAAKNERGHEALIHSAKALAMTAVDLPAAPDYANQIKEEFNSYKEQGFLNVPGIPPRFAPIPESFQKTFQTTRGPS